MATQPHPPTNSRAALLREFEDLPTTARINEKMLAAILLCSTAKLQLDRVNGNGVPFVREGGRRSTDKNGNSRVFGARIFYLKSDVLEFLAANNRTSKSTTAADRGRDQ